MLNSLQINEYSSILYMDALSNTNEKAKNSEISATEELTESAIDY